LAIRRAIESAAGPAPPPAYRDPVRAWTGLASASHNAAVELRTATPDDLIGPLNEVEQRHAPELLYWSGDLAVLQSGPRVSVVGSRAASPAGLARARRLTRTLVERDIVVVSGLAEGIDTAAHETAIQTGGRTLAVLGTPLDECFPAANLALQERICREHLAISQFASGAPVQRRNFPLRNRTMALLSEATIIVEAGSSSGTEHQGWEALRLGRLLYLLKSVAENPAVAWGQELLRYGAQVLSDENLEQVLEHMPARARGEQAPF
jgi:DNA processing protein